jgi:hypothetical protein
MERIFEPDCGDGGVDSGGGDGDDDDYKDCNNKLC